MASTSNPGTSSTLRKRKDSTRPEYSRFLQQELPAHKLILTPKLIIAMFLLIGIVFIPLGVAILGASRSVVEIVDRYDTECIPENYRDDKLGYIQNPTISKTCIRLITVPKDMKSPIYVYYQLHGFHQNHRRYVNSRSDKQLRDPSKEDETKTCDPEAVIGLKDDKKKIVPCGLIAWSMFNDTYSFSLGNNRTVEVNKTGISWKSDRDNRFGDKVFPKNFQNGTVQGGAHLNSSIPLSQQEDLIVWMRIAALPTFRKLYGRIEENLDAGQTMVVSIENNYNTYSFDGKKTLVLSTTSWLGGKSDFLGILYLAVGGLCLILAVFFTIIYLVRRRQLGDPSYLSWNRNPSGHTESIHK